MFYRMHGNNRRAHSDNLPHLIEQREDTAACINKAAASVGLSNRFDIQRDVDYRSFKALQLGGALDGGIADSLAVLQESIAIRRSPSDTLNRLVQRGICAPLKVKQFFVWLRGYLRFKLLGQEPKNIQL